MFIKKTEYLNLLEKLKEQNILYIKSLEYTEKNKKLKEEIEQIKLRNLCIVSDYAKINFDLHVKISELSKEILELKKQNFKTVKEFNLGDLVITKNGKIGILVFIFKDTTDKNLVVFEKDKTMDRLSDDELFLYKGENEWVKVKEKVVALYLIILDMLSFLSVT